MHIRSVHFRHFKSLRKVDLELGPLNILTGPNNGGKTTLLSALRLLDLAVSRARTRRPTSVRTPAGRRDGLRIDTDSVSTSVANVHTDLLPLDTTIDYVFVSGERLQLWFPSDGGCVLLGGDGANLPLTTGEFKKRFAGEVVQVPTLGPLEDREPLLKEKTVQKGLNTHRASRHFRNYWYRNPDGFDAFAALVARTWPGTEVSPPELIIADKGPMLQMFCEERRRLRELYWCGFGFQVWCQLLSHIVRAGPSSLLVVDEPETYLHPRVQRELVALLRSTGAQVVVASHSATVIASARAGEAIVLDGKDGVCRRPRVHGMALCRDLGLLPER